MLIFCSCGECRSSSELPAGQGKPTKIGKTLACKHPHLGPPKSGGKPIHIAKNWLRRFRMEGGVNRHLTPRIAGLTRVTIGDNSITYSFFLGGGLGEFFSVIVAGNFTA